MSSQSNFSIFNYLTDVAQVQHQLSTQVPQNTQLPFLTPNLPSPQKTNLEVDSELKLLNKVLTKNCK